ncbi:toxin-antitoxin system YwqK family antitoxin [Bacillus safensis]|uniref:toxin-antitoxin system YwqK family antitoxin n=1 Tax=Bacillus safensis TaxID=561879 RepID=UPI0004A46B4D|nr:hypothetical protein [Bacillus safensis]
MLNDILSKKVVLESGTEFEKSLEYGGPYELAIVEYTSGGEEQLFTGLAYDMYENGHLESYFYVEKGIKQGKYVEFYPNGFVKKIGYMRKNAVDGYQVEFFENGNKKYECECIAGREMTYIKYDTEGNVKELKAEPSESDLIYAEKFNG